MDRMIAAAIISNMKKRENEYSYLTFPSEMAPYRVASPSITEKGWITGKGERDICKNPGN
jgi:hypothetical protein